jgi:hypothetical protein
VAGLLCGGLLGAVSCIGAAFVVALKMQAIEMEPEPDHH